MQLSIKNIGPIGSAEIDLTGLTVIGGLNDSGKSTIGKTLFAIVKAIRNKEEEFAAGQGNKITSIVSELISELRRAAGPGISPSVFNNFTRGIRDVRRFSGDTGLQLFDAVSEDIKGEIIEQVERRTAHTFVRRSVETGEVYSIDAESRKVNAREILDNYFLRIRAIISEKQDSKATYSASFANILSAIFRGEINNKRRLDESGTIELYDDSQEVVSASFFKNSLNQDGLRVGSVAISALFEDATLIESPFILNFEDDLIIIPRLSSGEYSGSYSTYDLIEKLNFASKEAESSTPVESEITEKISQTIKGRMFYDSEEDTFIFSSNDDVNVKVTNTASGVKTLGIIQMLARAGVLNTSNLLIIDEPEVHLHPAWQILYAEIVAILVKNNVYCVVSSHSPYFIQALEAYSKLYGIDKLTKFYVSNKEEGVCNFSDVTDDTSPLYKLLADPMKRIAFLKAKAQNE